MVLKFLELINIALSGDMCFVYS